MSTLSETYNATLISKPNSKGKLMSDKTMTVEEFLASGGVIDQCASAEPKRKRKPKEKKYTRTVTNNRMDQYLRQCARKYG